MSSSAASRPPQEIAHRHGARQTVKDVDEAVDGGQVRRNGPRPAVARVRLARARHDHHELAVPFRLIGSMYSLNLRDSSLVSIHVWGPGSKCSPLSVPVGQSGPTTSAAVTVKSLVVCGSAVASKPVITHA